MLHTSLALHVKSSIERNRELEFLMNPNHNVLVRSRLERIKALWVQISKTPKTSERYEVLVDAIRAEARAYIAAVDAGRGVDLTKSA
jgi:hypothetical protein